MSTLTGRDMESESKSYQTLKWEETDRVVAITLNRPEVRNAFHPTMIAELTSAFLELSGRSDVAAVYLKGEGKSFCSGADLGYMQSMASFTLEENEKDSQDLFEMFGSIRSCPHPVVAKLHGHVMGGALGLAAVCDVSAAVEGTQFCFSEVKLGLVPAVISPFVLEKMHSAHARRLMLTAEVFDVALARESGLVDFAGSADEVDQFLEKSLSALKNNGPEAVRATKRLIREVMARADWKERKAMTTKLIAERRVSQEGQEGLKGFLEKRRPSWSHGS